MAEAARSRGMASIVLPPANGPEAALATGIEVRCIAGVSELRDIADRQGFGEEPAQLDLTETDAAKAEETVTAMCEKLLANTVIESYSVEIS